MSTSEERKEAERLEKLRKCHDFEVAKMVEQSKQNGYRGVMLTHKGGMFLTTSVPVGRVVEHPNHFAMWLNNVMSTMIVPCAGKHVFPRKLHWKATCEKCGIMYIDAFDRKEA